jgi:pyruvate/2-oxoglutarate dehydrogenase complex dihydrolipoamide dehydrogenase (E3) component
MKVADKYGLPSIDPGDIDTSLVWKRIRAVQQEISTTDDDPRRYEEMGVEIIHGTARLTGSNFVRVTLDDGSTRELETRFVLLCTGSRPAVPPIEGLKEAGFLTSENLFEIERAPRSVVMIGGGPIAIEMAQGFARLGVRTTVLQKGPGILPRDEPDLVEILTRILREDGVDLRLQVETQMVTVEGDQKVVHGTENGAAASWSAEDLLVAVGRRPNIEDLGLDDIGVKMGKRGVEVDNRMRTSVQSIYASGDLAGRFLFTHSAAYEGVRAIRDMFFPGKGTVTDFVPWCTFTDPELAHAGLTVAEAKSRYGDDEVEVWRLDLAHSDRARADGASDGAIIVVTHDKKMVGAHILGPSAGEMIHELALAIHEGLKFADVAALIHVYPTLSSSIGQLAAEAAFEGAKRLRWLVRKSR